MKPADERQKLSHRIDAHLEAWTREPLEEPDANKALLEIRARLDVGAVEHKARRAGWKLAAAFIGLIGAGLFAAWLIGDRAPRGDDSALQPGIASARPGANAADAAAESDGAEFAVGDPAIESSTAIDPGLRFAQLFEARLFERDEIVGAVGVAIDELDELQPFAALDAAREAMDNSDVAVAGGAALVLGLRGSGADLALLADALGDPQRGAGVARGLDLAGPRGVAFMRARLGLGTEAVDRDVLHALAESSSVAAIGLIEELADDSAHVALVFKTLSAIDSPDAAFAVLRLAELGRVDAEFVESAPISVGVVRSWNRLARQLVQGRDRRWASALAEHLLAHPLDGAEAGLLTLAGYVELPSDLRALAVEAAAESLGAAARGSAAQGSAATDDTLLATFVSSCSADDARLAATALLHFAAYTDARRALMLLRADEDELEPEFIDRIERELSDSSRTRGLSRLTRELRRQLPLIPRPEALES